jgi:hypothetical protein
MLLIFPRPELESGDLAPLLRRFAPDKLPMGKELAKIMDTLHFAMEGSGGVLPDNIRKPMAAAAPGPCVPPRKRRPPAAGWCPRHAFVSDVLLPVRRWAFCSASDANCRPLSALFLRSPHNLQGNCLRRRLYLQLLFTGIATEGTHAPHPLPPPLRRDHQA